MRLSLNCWLLFVSLASFAWQQNDISLEKINKEDLKYYVRILSHDSLQGRFPGAEGQKKAASFIAQKFRELDLDSMSTGYFQKFRLAGTEWDEVYLEKAGKRLRNFREMAYLGHLAQNEEVEKKLVFGGTGEDAELDHVDVRNKVVLVFTDNLRSTTRFRDKLMKRGAFAAIFANPDNNRQFQSIRNTYSEHALKKRIMLSGANYSDSIPRFMNFIIPNSQIKRLTDQSKDELQTLIRENRLNDFPEISIKLKCQLIKEEIETENVIGHLQGREPLTIVVSAHYDHLGIERKKVFPGADDNASGTAALIELAEMFSSMDSLRYSMIFLATSAEETGLHGSRYFVENLSGKVLVNLNMDMISRTDTARKVYSKYIYVIGTDIYPQFRDVIKKSDQDYPECFIDYSLNNSEDITGFYHRSDQYSFHKAGIPAIMFFAGLHDDYHSPSDTYRKIEFSLLEKRVRLIGRITQAILEHSFANGEME